MSALFSRLPIDPYIACILGMVALASMLPAIGSGMTVASGTGTAMIAAMFFLQGARLSPQAALAGARHWRLHSHGARQHIPVVPCRWPYGARHRARPSEPAPVGGMLMLCVLPSTVQSSIAFTSIARGNVAAAAVRGYRIQSVRHPADPAAWPGWCCGRMAGSPPRASATSCCSCCCRSWPASWHGPGSATGSAATRA